MAGMDARDGLTPKAIFDAVPWDELKKVIVVFENHSGEITSLFSESAWHGYFMDLAENNVVNAAELNRFLRRVGNE